MKRLTPRETLVELLRTYQEVACTLNGAGDWTAGKAGARYLIRPDDHPYFEGSYRTLETALRNMRAGGGLTGDSRYELAKQYWAVAETYIRCERRMVEREEKRRAKNNRTVTVKVRVVEPVRNGAVRAEDLEAGIDWLVAEFGRLGVSPFLPREYFKPIGDAADEQAA